MKSPTCGLVSYDDQRICARCGDDLGAAPKNQDKPIPPHAEYHFVEAESSLNPQPDLADTMEKIRESLEEIEGIESGSTSSREIESTVIVQPEVRSLEKGGFWIRLLAFAIDNFIGASGQTIGKMICRLKIVQTNGEPVSYGQAFLRWVGYLVSSIFFYLGFFWIVFDHNRQGWHDKIADIYVVRV